jgi:hypothetical protein
VDGIDDRAAAALGGKITVKAMDVQKEGDRQIGRRPRQGIASTPAP